MQITKLRLVEILQAYELLGLLSNASVCHAVVADNCRETCRGLGYFLAPFCRQVGSQISTSASEDTAVIVSCGVCPPGTSRWRLLQAHVGTPLKLHLAAV